MTLSLKSVITTITRRVAHLKNLDVCLLTYILDHANLEVNAQKKLCTFQHDQVENDSDKNMKNYESDIRHIENNLVEKDMVEDEDDSEILETSTIEKYYPDCIECAEKSENCVKCIIRNIRETDM